jgi:hypothetical protein
MVSDSCSAFGAGFAVVFVAVDFAAGALRVVVFAAVVFGTAVVVVGFSCSAALFSVCAVLARRTLLVSFDPAVCVLLIIPPQ